MPPARRGRPARRQSTVRQTRAQTAAVTVPFAPPPECAVREDFEDPPALQALLVDAQTVAVPTSAWEHSMERRVAASEKMLHEIHAAVLELRPAAVVESSTTQRPAARDRPISNSAAAFGSAAQMAASMGPVAIDQGAATSVQHPLRPDAVVQELAGACSDAAAPWPQVAELYATGNVDQMPLPRDTQDLIQSCSSASLPLDARVSDEIRAKIWAGDFIDLSILLKPSLTQDSSSEYALSIIGGVASPTIRVAPAKAKHSQIVSFETWSQAFQMYMSVYLLSPMYVHDATKMLKYIEVIRGLAEQGGNWRSYDEAFRSLRVSRGWNWDSVNWELWFKASQPPVTRRQPGASPFPVKGRTGGPPGPCFAFNRGEYCPRDTCPFAHRCKACGANHPSIRCFKAQSQPRRPGGQPGRPVHAGPPVRPPSSGPPPAWSGKK